MDVFGNQNNISQDLNQVQPSATPITPVTEEAKPSSAYGRFAANLFDGIYMGLVAIPVMAVFELILIGKLSIEKEVINQLENNVVLQIVAIIGFFGYYIWFNVNKGATPGKSAYKLTIVRYGTVERMGYGRALARELAKLIGYVPFIGIVYFLINAIIIVFSKQKRTLYDLIAGTQVVKK